MYIWEREHLGRFSLLFTYDQEQVMAFFLFLSHAGWKRLRSAWECWLAQLGFVRKHGDQKNEKRREKEKKYLGSVMLYTLLSLFSLMNVVLHQL